MGSRRGRFIVLRCVRPSDHHRCFHCCFHTPLAHSPVLTAIPQPTRQIAVCRLPVRRTQTGGTGRPVRLQCFCPWSAAAVSFHRWPRLALHRGGSAVDVPSLDIADAPHPTPRTPRLHIPHARRDPQAASLPRHRQAVGLQCFCHWRVTAVSIATPPCPPPWGACIVDCHCLIGDFDPWRMTKGSRRGHFIVLRCVRPWIIHRCFHCCFHTPPRALLHAHRDPARERADCCLPRHRQAVRLQCFYHWRVTDVFTGVSFTDAPPCSPPGGGVHR
jgi:hypothetical protein